MTDSPFVAVRAKPLNAGGMDHMAMRCDIYCGVEYAGTIRPKNMTGEIYETLINLPEGEKQITIDLPLYNGLAEIAVGLFGGAKVAQTRPMPLKKLLFSMVLPSRRATVIRPVLAQMLGME